MIWNGAAAVHAVRVGRIERKFLMWLNAHCRCRSPSLSYADLLKHFKLTSVSARSQHDILFIRDVFNGRILSESLLQAFSLSVPCRTTRQQTSTLLNVPFARVNAVKNGLFVRLPSQFNRFLERVPSADMFGDGYYAFRSKVKRFAAAL